MPDPKDRTPPPSPRDREVLDSGQEEVFSRTEVELGRTEHASQSGKRQSQSGPAPSADERSRPPPR